MRPISVCVGHFFDFYLRHSLQVPLTPPLKAGLLAAIGGTPGDTSLDAAYLVIGGERMRLDQMVPGLAVRNLVAGTDVTIVQVRPFGERVLDVVYRTPQGHVDSLLVYPDDAARVEAVTDTVRFAFDGDATLFRLASEAQRIHWAHLFDPHLAVHTSLLEPLPHQITAVYGEMLTRQPLRYLLADDPGAGKTIMAGLLIKELMLRGDVHRCLIVCPGALAEQWQDELADRFALPFEIVTNDRIEGARTGSIFAEVPLLVARLDKLSRDEELQDKLRQSDWDLVIVDEAHKMSASYFGSEVKETKRYKLGKLLSTLTRHFLLLTATPHDGKEEDFQLFMALLDGDRFEGRFRDGVHTADVTDLMRRLVKEQLYRFDGTPLFPERRAYTVDYALSGPELALYKAVTDYVREEFNRADALENGGRRGTVGFALTILQRRLASSPEAIYQSLLRRRQRLERRMREERLTVAGAHAQTQLGLTEPIQSEDDLEDLDEISGSEQEAIFEELVDEATAARTIGELEVEIDILKGLETLAEAVRRSEQDRKWQELSRLLQDEAAMFDGQGARRKLIIFTEHRDTLNYLVQRIQTLLGRPEAVVSIHGGTGREERRAIQERFTQDREVLVLVATDAAGEGINLQRAHLMVNYDLPWNPNRIEQRFGRIHRIGQTEVCHLWNLVAKDTREGEVYLTLLHKLEIAHQALGGAVFDVLGKAIDGTELRRLLIQAIRYGDQPAVRARLTEAVADKVDPGRLAQLVQDRALTPDMMDRALVERIREEMERALAQRLQPHYVSAYFRAMFTELGGTIHERETGRYEITHVPALIRSRDREIGRGNPVLPRYERVTFDKDRMRPVGLVPADLICPGHPLLDAVLDITLERYRPLLGRGTILIDPNDAGNAPRALVYLEHEIQTTPDPNGLRRTLSRRLQFVEVDAEGHAAPAGAAPYLDYRPPTDEERSLLGDVVAHVQRLQDTDIVAVGYTLERLVPQHLEEIRRRQDALVTKTLQAVKERLTHEITYWDHRARQLAEDEARGKPNASLNAAKARARADELEARLRARTEELERSRQVSARPPVVLGAALVIPDGLVRKLNGVDDPAAVERFARETKRVELLAMTAVVDAEKELGHQPRDVSGARLGYDVESAMGQGRLRFLEVKGRGRGADTVTVTANEIRTALNRPEQFVLALVEVDVEQEPPTTSVRYVRSPFQREPDFGADSVNYDWQPLWQRGVPPD